MGMIKQLKIYSSQDRFHKRKMHQQENLLVYSIMSLSYYKLMKPLETTDHMFKFT